jgi:hypothetical protein
MLREKPLLGDDAGIGGGDISVRLTPCRSPVDASAGPLQAKVPYTIRGSSALVAQRIEHLTTDQKVGGSSPSERAIRSGPRHRESARP